MNKDEIFSAGYMLTKIVEKKPQGLFLWGEFMHGDADHYTKDYLALASMEELQGVLKYIAWVNAMNHNAEIDYRVKTSYDQKENDFYKIVGEEFRENGLWDGVMDWWPRDVTYDGIRASLQKTWIIFSDESGEYTVKELPHE